MLRKQKLLLLRCLQGAPLSSQEEVRRTGLMRGFCGGWGDMGGLCGGGENSSLPLLILMAGQIMKMT